MVIRVPPLPASLPLLLADVEANNVVPGDPSVRARLVLALILLTIGGLTLIVLSWLALRIGRRHANRLEPRPDAPRRQLSDDDWARQRLTKHEE
jgi:hypothetical protein